MPMTALPILVVLSLSTMTATASTSTASTAEHDWLVLPILQFNDDAGLIYGIHFPVVEYSGGRDPYAWYFEIKLRHSTKNRHEHYALFDHRDVFRARLTVRADFLRIDDAHY